MHLLEIGVEWTHQLAIRIVWHHLMMDIPTSCESKVREHNLQPLDIDLYQWRTSASVSGVCSYQWSHRDKGELHCRRTKQLDRRDAAADHSNLENSWTMYRSEEVEADDALSMVEVF